MHNPAVWCAAEQGDLLDRGGTGFSVRGTAGGAIAEAGADGIGDASSSVLDAKSLATIHKSSEAMTAAASVLNRSGETAFLHWGWAVLSGSNSMFSPITGGRPAGIPTPKAGLRPQ